MQELFEEYGGFVTEAISGMLLLGILGYFYIGSPLNTLLQKFIISVLGGGM